MSKTIETKLASPPHSKKIHLNCANCYTSFHLTVPVEKTEGVVECDACGARTSWKEVDNAPVDRYEGLIKKQPLKGLGYMDSDTYR